MSGFIGNFTGANAANNAKEQATYQQQLEDQREQRVTAGTNAINGTFDSTFTPGFYAQQKQNYLDYAQPQLDQQYTNQQKQLTYQLARSGNLSSSSAGTQAADLAGNYNTAENQIQSTANQAALTAQSNVEGARASLISGVNATGDTAGATNGAIASATALSQQPTYSALGDLFASSTSALANQAAAAKQYSLLGGGSYVSPYQPASSAAAAPGSIAKY